MKNKRTVMLCVIFYTLRRSMGNDFFLWIHTLGECGKQKELLF